MVEAENIGFCSRNLMESRTVKASVSGEAIQFTISESTVSADDKVDSRNRTFKGRITKAQIIGKFTDSTETIKLPRKKSYWQ